MARFKICVSELQQLLSGYHPSGEEEHGHVAAVLDLLRTTEAPLDRNQFQPGHITSSALVRCNDSMILMIHHSKLKRWLQPGGHVEPEDASLKAAAAREVAEETSLHVSDKNAVLIDVDVHPIPARKSDPAHFHFDLRFYFDLGAERPEISAASDAADADWRPLPSVLLETEDPSIRRMLKKIEN